MSTLWARLCTQHPIFHPVQNKPLHRLFAEIWRDLSFGVLARLPGRGSKRRLIQFRAVGLNIGVGIIINSFPV